ncbi:phage tail sheath family protein [Burkholderia ubonensis]|uniref:phage tail sheath family protein n=1 Tax=Burkholderia ubonensis TaxID=101571 RepID=UPI000752A442|nr:phage tail sheath C-terminal domain-containing protein [Burkholderia ubonensis]KVN28373.1 phage tail protein [Burkholderia ubonensis]
MPITTSYPGVYIEELNSLSISVSSSATSVPVFAVGVDSPFQNVTRISSWMDYQRKVQSFYGANPDAVSGDDILYVSMRTYFENGGGYCFLVPTEELISEVPKLIEATTLVAAGQDITEAVAQLCQDGNCMFAILDGPTTDLSEEPDSGANAIYNTPYAAVYYPWLKAKWAGDTLIPPSAAMAGVYCKVDLTRGVWKAPANITLQGGVWPQYAVTDDLQGQYTKGSALNMIRVFNNGGTTVWGARTCEDSDSWRYISVRRLFNSAERDIKAAMKSAVFEPNSQPTWELSRSAIVNYLYRLYRQGALVGATENEAYFVDVGKDVTMTMDEINQGKMIIKVGMAAVRPAEFIILQFTQDVAQ